MPKFAVEGSTLMVRFSFPEMSVSHHRTLRIPISSVRSVSVDPRPWEWLSQYLKFAAGPPFPEVMDKIADAASGSGFPQPSVQVLGRATYINDDILKVVGPPGARVFTRFRPWLPALRVDLTEATPYIGFLVAHRDPEATAADLRAAIAGAR